MIKRYKIVEIHPYDTYNQANPRNSRILVGQTGRGEIVEDHVWPGVPVFEGFVKCKLFLDNTITLKSFEGRDFETNDVWLGIVRIEEIE